MLSRYSEARDRTMNSSEWSRKRRRLGTVGAYRRTSVNSIDLTRTLFSEGTVVWGIGLTSLCRERSVSTPLTSCAP